MIKACFYVNLYPQTVRDIAGQGFELVNVSSKDTSYWEAIGSYWGKDDLLILEQDMQFKPEFADSLESCPEPWCLYDYSIGNLYTTMCETGIGLCRIRKELQQVIPFKSDQPVHWAWTDLWLNRVADINGFRRHTHGVVEHYHDYGIPVPADVPPWELELKRTPNADDKTFSDSTFHNHPPPWVGCDCVAV